MSDRPQTWHYGLVARWWAEFNEAGEDELAFYRGVIERSGQPVLDAGCGTGRLLIPLLQAGFDIDGSDVSPDLLAFDHELPYEDAAHWPLWLPENRNQLPEPWPETGMRKRANDGDEIELRTRTLDLNPLE
jgi:SAM-dependent methyltransferase